MNKAVQLQILGQSIWYDSLKRSLIRDGTFKGMIERREILGITSNPSIFEKAINSDLDYETDLKMMSWAGLTSEEIFYRLAIQDIQDVADMFLPYYYASSGKDGLVSLEVNPKLARNALGTIDEAKWLWEKVNRPNLMIKIPATKESLPAITEVIAAGMNVTVTLIFSQKRYLEVMDAYIAGLEKRHEQGKDISKIASVAAFFVSRMDSKVDGRLQEIIAQGGNKAQKAQNLLGKLAIDNARLAYQAYLGFFNTQRFKALAEAGAQQQRPLWASTGTKNPAYSDVMYAEELIGENTINTLPPDTLAKFLDHGDPAIRIGDNLDRAADDFKQLEDLGISIDEVTQELEDEAVHLFSASFDGLIETIETKRLKYIADLGVLQDKVVKTLKNFSESKVIARVFRNDPTLWTSSADGEQIVQMRLGWRDLPTLGQCYVDEIQSFADHCRQDGFTKTLILGMGGSSLAPETMSLILGNESDGTELKILDSTLPGEVKAAEEWVDYPKTLFIVASKSGTTSEPLALYEYFKNEASKVLGKNWSAHFVAITDPGSKLEKLGKKAGFRAIFTADPNVGGRYSALTHFGLVPAALIGIDLEKFLRRAAVVAESCLPLQPIETNLGALLGIIIGEGAKNGQDKLTLLADKAVAPISPWLEQLIAESSGKEGKGIVPIADEPFLDANTYGNDRLFVYIRLTGEKDSAIEQLRDAGKNLLVLELDDAYDLAGQFYLWEFAVAIACSIIGVNAFDQPDVQDSKDRTKEKINLYHEKGSLEDPEVIWQKNEVRVYGYAFPGLKESKSLSDVIESFAATAKEGDYVAINAYLPRNVSTEKKLTALRKRILEQVGCATTLGFGPRFLHSTGQLHKGGANHGLFIQITQDDKKDLEIPEMGFSFGVLARAQAQGDLEALLARNKQAIRIHLSSEDSLDF